MSTSSGRGRGKRIAVLGLFLFILLVEYFWPFHIALADVRPHLPGFVDARVQGVLDRLPPDESKTLQVPLPELKYQCDFYFEPVVGRGEYNATAWILDNTNESDKFVDDIFGAELIMGMTTRVSTEGGDWANAPDPVSMMSRTNDIYKTDNASYARDLARLESADYVVVPARGHARLPKMAPSSQDFSKFEDARYFQPAFSDDNVTIYRIL
jgi:hypothetical protein